MNFFSRIVFVYVTVELAIGQHVVGLNVTIVTTGYDDKQRLSSAPSTAAGVYAAIMDYEFVDNYISFAQVILTYATAAQACNAAEERFDVVSNYYYSTEWSNNSMMIIVAPGCGDSLVLGSLAREWNVLMIATSAVYPKTRDREKYPTFISVSPLQNSVLVQSVFSLMSYYSWTTITVVYDIASTLASYYELASLMYQQVQSVHGAITLILYPISSTEPNWSPANMLLSISASSRVVMLSMHPILVRTIMLAANSLGMTNGEYAFLTTEAVRSSNNGYLTWKNGDENDLLAFQAYRTLLQVVVCPRNTTDQVFINHVADIAQHQHGIIYLPGDAKPAEVTISAYQSVEMVERVLLEMLMEGADHTDVQKLAKRFLNRNFELSGGSIYIDPKGQRRSDHCVNDLNIQTGQFEVVLRYFSQQEKTSLLPGKFVDWGTTEQATPLNEPVCGYLGKKSSCLRLQYWGINAAIIATFTSVGLCVIFVFIIVKLRKKLALQEQDWLLDAPLLLNGNQEKDTLTVQTTKKILQTPEWTYKGELVAVKTFNDITNTVRERKTVKVFVQLRKLHHTNIVQFIGVCMANTEVHLVSEFCSRASLDQFLNTSRPTYFDWNLLCSLISDTIEGITAIHGSFFKRHGNLTFSTCMVDSRFTLKISELGYSEISANPICDIQKSGPESDIFALGIVIESLCKAQQIADTVHNECGSEFIFDSDTLIDQICKGCKSDLYGDRPSIWTIRHRFSTIAGCRNEGILASILNKTQDYTEQMESAVLERTLALTKEKQANEDLLLEILPWVLIERLSSGYDVPAETFSSCTIFFCHIYSFVDFVAACSAFEVVLFLNNLFALYDDITARFQVYKVETIGDSYMVVSGIPIRNSDMHAQEICTMALQFSKCFASHATSNSKDLQFIAGAHSGPCVAGVIGSKRPRYCLFGDTVNIASRMASHGEPSRIHISISTAYLLQGLSCFSLPERGRTTLKGRGEILTFWLEDQSHNQC